MKHADGTIYKLVPVVATAEMGLDGAHKLLDLITTASPTPSSSEVIQMAVQIYTAMLSAAPAFVAHEEMVEKVRKAISKPLSNMKGGCFMPDNGRSQRGDCADGDCYCARVANHCATAAIKAVLETE